MHVSTAMRIHSQSKCRTQEWDNYIHLYLYEQQRCQMWSRNSTNNQLHVFNKFRIFKVVYCRILFVFCHSSIFTKALPDCLWLIRLDIFGIFQLCCSSKVWGTQSYHWSRYYVSVHERKMDILHTKGQRMCYWVNWKIINLKVEISMWRRFGLESSICVKWKSNSLNHTDFWRIEI